MARIARVVIPGLAHHITQRGNRRQQTFFNDGDYAAYVELMAEWCRDEGVQIWSYCLMPNHTHLIAVPSSEEGLRRAIGEAHSPLHATDQLPPEVARLSLARAVRVVRDGRTLSVGGRAVHRAEPGVREACRRFARLAVEQRAAHLLGKDDPLVKVAPLLTMIADWRAFLDSAMPEGELRDIRRHSRTGRPLGDDTFLARLEGMVGRMLRPKKPGPKKETAN